MLADKMRNVLDDRRRGADRGRQLVPHAHRRRHEPAAQRHADRAPGRDPGEHGRPAPDRASARGGVRTATSGSTATGDARRDRGSRMSATFLGVPAPRGVGHLRGDTTFPKAARAALAEHPAAPQPRPRHGRHPQRSAPHVVAELDDWEQLRLAGEAIKRSTMARLDEHLERLEREVTARGGDGALGPRRQRGQRDRHPAGAGDRRDRGRQGQVDGHPGDRAQRGARGGRHHRVRDRPRRADRPARARQAVAHPGAGDPPQPRRDPGDLPARDGRTCDPDAHRRAAPAGDGRPGAPAAQVPARAKVGDLRGELRRRRDRDAAGRRVRGQRPDVPDAARDADHRHGHREGGADLAATSRCSCSCCPARRPASG